MLLMAGQAQLIKPSSTMVILLPFLGETGVSVRGIPITYSFPSSIRLDLITTSGVSVLRLSR